MRKTTGSGKLDVSRSASRDLTRRRFATLGTLVLMALGVAAIVTLLNPGWWAQ